MIYFESKKANVNGLEKDWQDRRSFMRGGNMFGKRNLLRNVVVLSMIAVVCMACAAARPKSAPLPDAAAPMAAPMEEAMKAEVNQAAGEMAAPGAPVEDLAPQKAGGKRLVIKNVDIAIVVKDPILTMEKISDMAEEMGGFVVTSNRFQRTLDNGVEVPQATITVRVPAEKLDEALEEIKADVTEVQNEIMSVQDVTQEYTDLQSRLRNLEAAEAELRKIMENAYTTEDVMNVYRQLVEVREQIEVVKGQIQYYETSATFSAIKVDIIAEASIQPVTVGGWQPVGEARDAVQALINALKFLVNVAIWLVIFFLPIMLIIGIPIWLLVKGLRRLFSKRKQQAKDKAAVQAKAEEEKPGEEGKAEAAEAEKEPEK